MIEASRHAERARGVITPSIGVSIREGFGDTRQMQDISLQIFWAQIMQPNGGRRLIGIPCASIVQAPLQGFEPEGMAERHEP
jgi:hypothetical protein